MPPMRYCACGERFRYVYGEPYCPKCDGRDPVPAPMTCSCDLPLNADGKCPDCDYLPRPFGAAITVPGGE